MPSTVDRLCRAVIVENDLGLHARSAAKLAKVAQEAEGHVWLEFGEYQVDAKQVIDILTLGAAKGDQVVIRVEQEHNMDILNRMTALFEDGFGE